jgi:4-hydroxyacetophenone monooxygenase
MTLREAVQGANVPTLIPVLVQLTGDMKWLEPPYTPRRNRGLDDNHDGGLPPEIQQEIRDAAAAVITDTPIIDDPSPELLVRMLSVSMGEPVPDVYGPMIADELGLGPDWPAPERVPDDFKVLVIGAGISGLAAGIRLQEAGIPFTILEKAEEVGGTWRVNRYPGAGVDTPSALYSFSFAQQDWTQYFALRDELFDYLRRVAEPVRPHIRFGVEVLGAGYDADAQEWAVELGGGETLRANVLISAVGGFGRPKLPEIEGLDSFAGPCVHTARWPEDLSLTGKRVAVIGNGASAMQLVPAIIDDVRSIIVYQRSPQWAAPFDQFLSKVPEAHRKLVREVPLYRIWYRLRSGWTFNDRIHDALQKDPDWPHPERSVSEINDGHREFFTRYMERELGGDRELIEKALPHYPPFGKRILLDNGWFKALTREHVELITDPIERVTPHGVVSGGEERELDVLVCATGFDVVRFLAPLEIRGRSGQTIRDAWDDEDARAYKGMTVPDFPNLFILYGPNTQAGHGGSLIGSAEAQLHYIMDLLAQMLDGGIGAVECRQEVYDAWAREVDARHERMVWTHPGMDTYYRNSRGRVVVNTPFRVVDIWQMTRHADLGDFVVEPAVALQGRSHG